MLDGALAGALAAALAGALAGALAAAVLAVAAFTGAGLEDARAEDVAAVVLTGLDAAFFGVVFTSCSSAGADQA